MLDVNLCIFKLQVHHLNSHVLKQIFSFWVLPNLILGLGFYIPAHMSSSSDSLCSDGASGGEIISDMNVILSCADAGDYFL